MPSSVRARGLALRAAIATAVLAGGLFLGATSGSWWPHTTHTAPPRPLAATGPEARVVAAAPMARSQPVSIDIPSLHVRSRLDTLGLDRNGEVQVPPIEADAPAGWYEGSSTPGEKGAAVILGHSTVGRYGTGVFYRLGVLRAGQAVLVHRADGTTAHFTVVRLAEYPKSDFPAREVYGDTADAELRLITCGNYDEAAHAYQDNVVVYAKLTGSSAAD